MKAIATASIDGSYGTDHAMVQRRTSGQHKGTYRVIGGGFAGRVAYRTAESAMAQIERHARFIAWQ